MSRIGKKAISIPNGVNIEAATSKVKVTGPLGTLNMDVSSLVKIELDKDAQQVQVVNPNPDSRKHRQMHGTTRALLANMVTGVSKGFERKMEIYGTGFNLKEQGGKLVLQVGFCHPVEMKLPEGVKINIDVPATRGNDVPAKFTLSGPDKHVLGQFAANVRRVRPPEPYKGKGIRYADEQVRRKVGKAFATGSA